MPRDAAEREELLGQIVSAIHAHRATAWLPSSASSWAGMNHRAPLGHHTTCSPERCSAKSGLTPTAAPRWVLARKTQRGGWGSRCGIWPNSSRHKPSPLQAQLPPLRHPLDEKAPSTSRHWGLHFRLRPSLRSGGRPSRPIRVLNGQMAALPAFNPSSNEHLSRYASCCSSERRYRSPPRCGGTTLPSLRERRSTSSRLTQHRRRSY